MDNKFLFERKSFEFKNVDIMNEENGKCFVDQLKQLYNNRPKKYFESLCIKWLQLFFDSKSKFPPALWTTTLRKIYKLVLKIMLLTDIGLQFSLRFLSILVDSNELKNIKKYSQDFDQFVSILAKLHIPVCSCSIFCYQRLFFKLVFNLVQVLGKKLVRDIIDNNLIEKILKIEQAQFEKSIRTIINEINDSSDVFKCFPIVADSIKIGDTVFDQFEILPKLWIDFNITVMEISFHFENNGELNVINIPTNCITDIITSKNGETEINIVLNSNRLPLESGAYFIVNGTNCVTIKFPNGETTDTLNDYIIPEYLKSLHSQHSKADNNMEILANDTGPIEDSMELDYSGIAIMDSSQVIDSKSQMITNGLYEDLKTNTNVTESQFKTAAVQRVEPLPKNDVPITTVSEFEIPESQHIFVRQLRYREIYSNTTYGTPVLNKNNSLPNGSRNVDFYATQYESSQRQANDERFNDWLNMAHSNMNRVCNTYKDKNRRKFYFLRSSKVPQEKLINHDLQELVNEFRESASTMVVETKHEYQNTSEDYNENKLKHIRSKYRDVLTNSHHTLTECIRKVQNAEENIHMRRNNLLNMLENQTRRIQRYKATVAAYKADINELNAKSLVLTEQLKLNLKKSTESAEHQVWNNHILNLSRQVQDNFVQHLY